MHVHVVVSRVFRSLHACIHEFCELVQVFLQLPHPLLQGAGALVALLHASAGGSRFVWPSPNAEFLCRHNAGWETTRAPRYDFRAMRAAKALAALHT